MVNPHYQASLLFAISFSLVRFTLFFSRQRNCCFVVSYGSSSHCLISDTNVPTRSVPVTSPSNFEVLLIKMQMAFTLA